MPPKLLFGAGGIGEGRISHTWTNAEETSELLAILKELGLTELDSAASYPPGAPWVTERLLGETKAAERGFVIDTKILAGGGSRGSLSEKAIDESLAKSFELLGVESVNILYAHVPDKTTPMEETARAFDKHYRAGKFKKLGLCNYSTAQMTEYLRICTEKNYIKPSIYQGHYNAIVRQDESSLFPLLRSHGITINAYGPLAGGFLTGKVTIPPPEQKTKILEGGRFAPGNFPVYEQTFDNEVCHNAIRAFVGKCEEEGLTATEVSLRWVMGHSELGEGDGVILGATKVGQLEGSVGFCGKGKLSGELVRACEELWGAVEGRLEGMFG